MYPILVQKNGTGKKDSARNAADKRASPKYNFLHVLMVTPDGLLRMGHSASFTIFREPTLVNTRCVSLNRN
jgi:hypothetical protein